MKKDLTWTWAERAEMAGDMLLGVALFVGVFAVAYAAYVSLPN